MAQPDVSVEIKVNLADVETAMQRLELGAGKRRSVWFLEDLTPGLSSPAPLLAAGVIVRLRSTQGSDDDVTVKLRPCRWSQLTDEWSDSVEGDDFEYRIEADWSRSRRALAASYQADLPEGTSADVSSSGDLSTTFLPRQQELVDACASVGVRLTALTSLGPVDATRWKDRELGPFEVDAERWRLDDLDFLEISLRVDAAEAESTQRELEQQLLDLQLTFADEQLPKTSLVVQRLVARG